MEHATNCPRRRWWGLALVPALAVGLVAAACGDDDDADTDDASGGPVAVTLVDYGFDFDASALSTGEFTVEATNDGDEFHEIVVIQVPADVDLGEAAEVIAAIEDPAAAPEGYGLVGILGFAAPGTSFTATVPQAESPAGPEVPPIAAPLEPGRYAFVCFVPVGTVDETTAVDGPPHLLEGMIADFTVS